MDIFITLHESKINKNQLLEMDLSLISHHIHDENQIDGHVFS